MKGFISLGKTIKQFGVLKVLADSWKEFLIIVSVEKCKSSSSPSTA